MDRVDVDDVESEVGGVARSPLSDPLGTTDVAVNRYRVPPGEGLPAGLHAHRDQEELFVVLSGAARFELLAPTGEAGDPREPEGRTVTVEAGEAVRFAPGEFQSGHNDADRELVVLAVGAPRDSSDVRIPATCPGCGRPDLRIDTEGGQLSFVCPDCGTERVPADCPDCGGADLRIRLAEDGGTETACRDCGATFPAPPFRE